LPELVQSITFRLHDSVPASVIASWQAELDWREEMDSTDPANVELRKRIERFLDQGHGACFLRDPRVAALVEGSLLQFDGRRYRLLAWCVMPNHVHALIEVLAGHPVGSVVHSWKSYTAKEANKFLGRVGAFWMKDYHDRYIRDEAHYQRVISYIAENPRKAGLVAGEKQWPWSGTPGAVPEA